MDVVLLDGAAIVNFIRPNETMKTFADYAEHGFVPFIINQLKRARRVDIVWDTYQSNSLKAFARQKRGTGIRTLVTSRTPLPKKWNDFLRDNENKTDLFQFLSFYVQNIKSDIGTVVATVGAMWISTCHL